MPTYDYRCQIDGTRFSVLRRYSEMDNMARCPVCHEFHGVRIFGGPSSIKVVNGTPKFHPKKEE